jgi:hypothetical protein
VDGGAVEGTLKIRRNRKLQFMNASLVEFSSGARGSQIRFPGRSSVEANII